MSSAESPDTPIVRAVKEREQLQRDLREATDFIAKIDDFLKAYERLPAHVAKNLEEQLAPMIAQKREYEEKLRPIVQRLGQLDQFFATWRSLASPDGQEAPLAEPSFGRAGWGATQPLFERFAVLILKDIKRPMQSGEFVEEFRRRGHYIGGENETKTAWNRLWQARRNGVLVHTPHGYWLPGEPLTEQAKAAADAVRKERRKNRTGLKSGRPKSKRRGARRLLSEAQVEMAEKWLASGRRIADVCADLGGISVATLWNYIPGRLKGVRERHPELAAQAASRLKRPRYVRKIGESKRPYRGKISGDVAAKAEAMYLSGASMKDIAAAINVDLTSAYRYFSMGNKEYWQKRRAEAQIAASKAKS